MYQYILGRVEEIGLDYVVIDNNGIGYFIYSSKKSLLDLNEGKENVKIYTYLNVREDGISLYGFTTKEELEMFKLLLVVSKIGPKVGIGLLSSMSPSQIKLAIHNNDSDALSKAPGIGKKTANRIILELKDKIDNVIDLSDDNHYSIEVENTEEAVFALMSLGYTRAEINSALHKIDSSSLKTEELIKLVLKELSKK